jgi:prolyl-tRNA editing enzyme YbaK/EbsC (Cys-tRNA(Pro) deacylase)
MNPKEKAVQLFNKYYVSILEVNNDLSEEILISILAKKQALIAVDEVLELTGGYINQFYRKVKIELTIL